MELAMNFNSFKSGTESHKLRFYVGHDGSMIRLASGLGFGKVAPLRWPALGSEIVMEVRLFSIFAVLSFLELLMFACDLTGMATTEK